MGSDSTSHGRSTPVSRARHTYHDGRLWRGDVPYDRAFMGRLLAEFQSDPALAPLAAELAEAIRQYDEDPAYEEVA